MSQSSSRSRSWGTVLIIVVVAAVAALNLITEKSLEGMMSFVSKIQQKVSGSPETPVHGQERMLRLLLKVSIPSDEASSSDKSESDSSDQGSRDEIVKNTLKVIRRRLDLLGLTNAQIEQSGSDNILVHVPETRGDDVLRLVTRKAELSFQLVRQDAAASEAELEKLPERSNPESILSIEKKNLLENGAIKFARAERDKTTRQAVLSFGLDEFSAQAFAQITRDNVGKRMAIVLDDGPGANGEHGRAILTAPIIQTPILSGQVHVSGLLTLEEVTELALLLSSGPLPATVQIVEQKRVKPKTGTDPPRKQ